MKYLLFILLAASCTEPELVSLPAKSIKVDSTRYFFIGYAIGDNQKGSITWVSNSGNIPIKKDLLDAIHKSKEVLPFMDRDFVILSLYEFKNKEECYTWDDANVK